MLSISLFYSPFEKTESFFLAKSNEYYFSMGVEFLCFILGGSETESQPAYP